jgi:hypothetical protein
MLPQPQHGHGGRLKDSNGNIYSPTLGTSNGFIFSSPKFSPFVCFHSKSQLLRHPSLNTFVPGRLGAPWRYTATCTATPSFLLQITHKKATFFARAKGRLVFPSQPK